MGLTALAGTVPVGITAACKIGFSRFDHTNPSILPQQQGSQDSGGQYAYRDEHTEPEHRYHLSDYAVTRRAVHAGPGATAVRRSSDALCKLDRAELGITANDHLVQQHPYQRLVAI
jgi:hypothetical protein